MTASTVDAIPSDAREWQTVLKSVAVQNDEYADSRRDVLAPLSEDVVVSGLVARGASESAAATQLDISAGVGDVEHVNGESRHGHVAGYVPAASERSDESWALPGDAQGDAGMVEDDGESRFRADPDDDDPPVGANIDFGSNGDDGSSDAGWEQYVDADAPHPVTADRVTAALNAAQEYFQSELTGVQRDGIRERWGLSERAVADAGIGFCPDRDDLREHLRDAGFTEKEMLATGLFTSGAVKHAVNGCDDPVECPHDVPEDLEMLAAAIRDGDVNPRDVDIGAVIDRVAESDGLSLYQWWDARLTFPYFDAGGDVVFFAARATGGTEDIVYGDGSVAKYVKLSKRKAWTHPTVDEPLFGAAELPENPGEVVVTEGLTDVLAARQHGYAAFGPATTEFKHDAVETAAAAVENAETVYVVMDNDDHGEDADLSPGLNGALKTAAVLREHDVEAEVGVLPRVEGETDMADYLKTTESDDPLREVLEDARSPREFDAFDAERHAPGTQNEQTGDVSGSDGSAVGGDGDVDSSGSSSALFDLTIHDVAPPNAPSRPGERGENPFLGALNESGQHFTVTGDEEAFDHHASVKSGYTPLTWLLCDAGERDPRDPSGSLSDEEVFKAWVHAKREGVIPSDDRIPWRARLHVLREHELMPAFCIPDEYAPEQVPESVWSDVVETVREEYGVRAGMEWV